MTARRSFGRPYPSRLKGKYEWRRFMRSPHRFLLLEDDANDTELIQRALKAEWPECEVVPVQTGRGYESNLRESRFDLVLCDYCLPGFGGMEALAFAREHFPDLPLI